MHYAPLTLFFTVNGIAGLSVPPVTVSAKISRTFICANSSRLLLRDIWESSISLVSIIYHYVVPRSDWGLEDVDTACPVCCSGSRFASCAWSTGRKYECHYTQYTMPCLASADTSAARCCTSITKLWYSFASLHTTLSRNDTHGIANDHYSTLSLR